jgi:hypothetical protein
MRGSPRVSPLIAGDLGSRIKTNSSRPRSVGTSREVPTSTNKCRSYRYEPIPVDHIDTSTIESRYQVLKRRLEIVHVREIAYNVNPPSDEPQRPGHTRWPFRRAGRQPVCRGDQLMMIRVHL